MTRNKPYYLQDLRPGMRFVSGSIALTEADILRFAEEFDPQPQHTDPQAAQHSLFGGLVASGWHTMALVSSLAMRSELRMADNQIGLGIRDIRFYHAVRPGDQLHLEMEILETQLSRSRPGWGIIQAHWKALNQHGDLVLELQPTIMVRARIEDDNP